MAYTVVKGDTLSSIASKLGVSLSALEAANPMSNFNRIGIGQQINVPGKSAAAAAAPAAVDPNSQQYQTALSEYGAVATFAQNNGEVNGILQQAIQGEWDAARFERALWGTNWYKSLSDNQRQLQVQQATDPGSYQQQLHSMSDKITGIANGIGVNIDPASLAQQALWNGWDQATLTRLIAQQGTAPRDANGYTGGQIGDVENHLRTTYASYGIKMADSWYTNAAQQVAAGTQTTGGLDNEAVGYASKMYPQYAQDFFEGRTLSDIAQPFIQQMGQTLEVDPSSINLMTDPTIQKALQGDGKTPMTTYQFQQQLKADPRWGKTDNAKNAAYDTLAQIGKDWGFMS